MPLVEILLGHRRAVTANEKCLVGCAPLQPPLLPLPEQKATHSLPHACPQLLAVALAADPRQTARDRDLQEDHQPLHGERLAFQVGIERAGRPDTHPATDCAQVPNGLTAPATNAAISDAGS